MDSKNREGKQREPQLKHRRENHTLKRLITNTDANTDANVNATVSLLQEQIEGLREDRTPIPIAELKMNRGAATPNDDDNNNNNNDDDDNAHDNETNSSLITDPYGDHGYYCGEVLMWPNVGIEKKNQQRREDAVEIDSIKDLR